MPSLPDYLEYLSPCRVVLCKDHGLCLRQSQVLPHLRSEKHNISGEALDAIVQTMSDLNIAEKLMDICLPVAGSVPIKGLPILDGFECCCTMECPYLTVSVSGLKFHLSTYHNGIEGYKKKIDYQNKVKLQAFFPGSPTPGYFIVNPESSACDFPQVSAMSTRKTMQPSSSKKLRMEVIDLEDEDSSEGGDPSSKDSHYPDFTFPPRRLRSANPQNSYAGSQKSSYSTAPTTPVKRRTEEASPLGSPKRRSSHGFSSNSLKFADSFFAQTIFYAERRDKDLTHICQATNLMPPDSTLPVNAENLDFDLYCEILRNKEILEYGYQLEFTDVKGRRAQITDQMTFRAAILVQVGQKADRITFHAKRIAQVAQIQAPPTTTPSSTPVQMHPIEVSAWANSFAHTVFRTECLDTGELHICLASDFTTLTSPSSPNAIINLNSNTVEFESYCRLLRQVNILSDDQTLGFNDTNGKRIPITNQMAFRAAVTYQVSREADMISFTSSRSRSKGAREGGAQGLTGVVG